MKLRAKDWEKFQHYKERKPPWIKLHRDLLDNFDFQRLPDASRALAPCLWLLCSEFENGEIEEDVDWFCFRLRRTEAEFRTALKPLIDKGFFSVDSIALASRKQEPIPETETETEKRENNAQFYKSKKGRKLTGAILERFDKFMDAFGYKKDRASAADAWLANGEGADFETIIRAAKREAARRPELVARGLTPIYPQGWLSGRRWEDEDLADRQKLDWTKKETWLKFHPDPKAQIWQTKWKNHYINNWPAPGNFPDNCPPEILKSHFGEMG